MKKCAKCKELKPKERYARRPAEADGRCTECLDCVKERLRKRREEINHRKQFEII